MRIETYVFWFIGKAFRPISFDEGGGVSVRRTPLNAVYLSCLWVEDERFLEDYGCLLRSAPLYK